MSYRQCIVFSNMKQYGINKTIPHSTTSWIIPFAVQLIPSGLLLIGAFWLRESPRWLMTKGKREQAIKNLCWIRSLPADDIYIQEEIYAIDANIEGQMAAGGLGFWQPFKLLASSRKIQWRFFLGGSLFFWQNTSGINAINYYSPTIFKSIGITGTNTSLFTTGLFGVVKTVFTLIYLVFLIDQYGRRRLLMIGAVGGSVCLWYVGAYIAIAKPQEHPHTTLPPSGISAIFFFYLWTVSSRLSTQPSTTTNNHNRLSTPPHGTPPHGSTTPRCSTRTYERSRKPSQQQTTGSGISWSHDSLPRCSTQWATVFISSSPPS